MLPKKEPPLLNPLFLAVLACSIGSFQYTRHNHPYKLTKHLNRNDPWLECLLCIIGTLTSSSSADTIGKWCYTQRINQLHLGGWFRQSCYTHEPLNEVSGLEPARPLVGEVIGADTVVSIAICYDVKSFSNARQWRLTDVTPVASLNGGERKGPGVLNKNSSGQTKPL